VKITRFEDIEAWKAARVLNRQILDATKPPFFEQDWDLRRQIRRSAGSAMANIAEGFDGGSDREFRRFLRIARRSVTEVQSHLYAALDLSYLAKKDVDGLYEQCVKVKSLIGGFIRYLNLKETS